MISRLGLTFLSTFPNEQIVSLSINDVNARYRTDASLLPISIACNQTFTIFASHTFDPHCSALDERV